eukprot:11992525-Alexandrium_andersonii.AAC.1
MKLKVLSPAHVPALSALGSTSAVAVEPPSSCATSSAASAGWAWVRAPKPRCTLKSTCSRVST